MPYMTDLKWMSDLGEYSEIEQKVLLALSTTSISGGVGTAYTN